MWKCGRMERLAVSGSTVSENRRRRRLDSVHTESRTRTADGWHADLRLGKSDLQGRCALETGDGCRVHESQYTACLNDGFGNCGGYSCDLCDFEECPR